MTRDRRGGETQRPADPVYHVRQRRHPVCGGLSAYESVYAQRRGSGTGRRDAADRCPVRTVLRPDDRPGGNLLRAGQDALRVWRRDLRHVGRPHLQHFPVRPRLGSGAACGVVLHDCRQYLQSGALCSTVPCGVDPEQKK